MLLVADSGSTKTDWRLWAGAKNIIKFRTRGYNPVYLETSAIFKDLQKHIVPALDPKAITEVCFYGAGCSTVERAGIVKSALRSAFPSAKIMVMHDVLGAARSAFAGEKGIVSILGTGTNACVYDGKHIVKGLPSFGYLFGDEGSGAFLGKTLAEDYLKGRLSKELSDSFHAIYDLNPDQLIERVYGAEMPNQVLASFAPFFNFHREDEYIERTLYIAFQKFFDAFLEPFEESKTLPVRFIGSVANNFQDVLKEIGKERGVNVNGFVPSPIDALIDFHLAHRSKTGK